MGKWSRLHRMAPRTARPPTYGPEWTARTCASGSSRRSICASRFDQRQPYSSNVRAVWESGIIAGARLLTYISPDAHQTLKTRAARPMITSSELKPDDEQTPCQQAFAPFFLAGLQGRAPHAGAVSGAHLGRHGGDR